MHVEARRPASLFNGRGCMQIYQASMVQRTREAISSASSQAVLYEYVVHSVFCHGKYSPHHFKSDSYTILVVNPEWGHCSHVPTRCWFETRQKVWVRDQTESLGSRPDRKPGFETRQKAWVRDQTESLGSRPDRKPGFETRQKAWVRDQTESLGSGPDRKLGFETRQKAWVRDQTESLGSGPDRKPGFETRQKAWVRDQTESLGSRPDRKPGFETRQKAWVRDQTESLGSRPDRKSEFETRQKAWARDQISGRSDLRRDSQLMLCRHLSMVVMLVPWQLCWTFSSGQLRCSLYLIMCCGSRGCMKIMINCGKVCTTVVSVGTVLIIFNLICFLVAS